MVSDLQLERVKHLSTETIWRVWQTSKPSWVVAFIMGAGYITLQLKTNIRTLTQTESCVCDYLPMLNALLHTYTQQHRHHTHTHFRDMGPILTTAELTWHWSDWSDPRKAKRTHESAGAFVFVECHTSSRGKPITGPGRPLKLWEGCVWIASAATSDVNSNILIAGYFLD